MKTALIGYTGFVGGNLLGQRDFSHKYNSKNIHEIKGQEFDLLVCAGIPAEMFVANQNPARDKQNIQDILDILAVVKAKKAVLISTIAVYPQPVIADENSTQFDTDTPYGYHRRIAEEQFAQHFEQHLVVRLPALFGHGIKKNFLFDIINPSPMFLKSEKFEELLPKAPLLKKYYSFNDSKGMYQFQKELAAADQMASSINDIFNGLNFTSLQFTNADSKFQFYNLNNLYKDISIAFSHGIEELNICSSPISPREIMQVIFNKNFNAATAPLFNYDMKSIHAGHWNNDTYLYNTSQVLQDLKDFFKENGVL